MSAEIKTTLGNGDFAISLERLRQALAPNGDWTAANAHAAECDKKELIDGAKKRYDDFISEAGLESFSEKITRIEPTGSDEHKLFIATYLDGFEKVFNRKVPGMFVSGGTGIGKTYNAVMFCKNAMWSPDFQKTVKTEWNGRIYEVAVPASCAYLTSEGLISRLEGGWRQGLTKERVLSSICSRDIVVIDDVGFPSDLGRKNAEVGAVNSILRAKPTGLIVQTRLSPSAFAELFGSSAADITRRFAKPITAGCQSRRTWERQGGAA